MPTAQLFSPNGAGTRWNRRGNSREGSLDTRPHVERWVYINYGRRENVMRIEQDAFPCDDCSRYFLQQTGGNNKLVLFSVTEDSTFDRGYHETQGLPRTAGYPCNIYYWNGAVSYNVAPGGAPAHPPV